MTMVVVMRTAVLEPQLSPSVVAACTTTIRGCASATMSRTALRGVSKRASNICFEQEKTKLCSLPVMRLDSAACCSSTSSTELEAETGIEVEDARLSSGVQLCLDCIMYRLLLLPELPEGCFSWTRS